MRSDLTRSPHDPRFVECGDGEPRCQRAPDRDSGDNPLGLCADHLSAHRKRCKIPEPVKCPACNPISVYAHGRYVVIPGVMCFACNRTNGGTIPSEEHGRYAAYQMRARMLILWSAGDRGPEWVALMARCPAHMREAFERRIARVSIPP
jgi:hypothetical protein